MVMVLEQAMVDAIAQIGYAAYPNEACGLLLPEPVRGQQVVELPNRSKEPLDSVEMDAEDLVIQLEMLYGDNVPSLILPNITWWHTHPSGNIGPSKFDIENKPYQIKCLVVTLWPEAEDKAPVATWF